MISCKFRSWVFSFLSWKFDHVWLIIAISIFTAISTTNTMYNSKKAFDITFWTEMIEIGVLSQFLAKTYIVSARNFLVNLNIATVNQTDFTIEHVRTAIGVKVAHFKVLPEHLAKHICHGEYEVVMNASVLLYAIFKLKSTILYCHIWYIAIS